MDRGSRTPHFRVVAGEVQRALVDFVPRRGVVRDLGSGDCIWQRLRWDRELPLLLAIFGEEPVPCAAGVGFGGGRRRFSPDETEPSAPRVGAHVTVRRGSAGYP